MGFPGGTSGKESACQCRRCKSLQCCDSVLMEEFGSGYADQDGVRERKCVSSCFCSNDHPYTISRTKQTKEEILPIIDSSQK